MADYKVMSDNSVINAGSGNDSISADSYYRYVTVNAGAGDDTISSNLQYSNLNGRSRK